MTVGEWLKQWLEEARHTVSPQDARALSGDRRTSTWCRRWAPIQLAKLAPVHIQGFYSDALSSGRLDGKGGLSPQTVVHFDRVLNMAMKRARKLRLIASNPVEDVDRPEGRGQGDADLDR